MPRSNIRFEHVSPLGHGNPMDTPTFHALGVGKDRLGLAMHNGYPREHPFSFAIHRRLSRRFLSSLGL